MKSLSKWIALGILTCFFISQAQAIDINLINVDLGSPETQRLSNLYGDAYGFPANQVAPALLGPPEEAPAVLQIAQAAGTVPMTVWMMRRMGMSYSRILQSFALAPTALMGGGLGGPSFGAYPSYPGWFGPSYGGVMDSFWVQTARYTFLRDVLKVSPQFIPFLPFRGLDFQRALFFPVHPVHGTWMPPGIAKKYGLWMPPGQAKKLGWNPWGVSYDKWDWKGGDWKDGDWKGNGHGNKDKGPGWKTGSKGDDGVSFENSNAKVEKGKGKSKAEAKGKGGPSDNGGGKGKGNGGGKGKGKPW